MAFLYLLGELQIPITCYISVNWIKCTVLTEPCSFAEYSPCFLDLLKQLLFQFRPQVQNRDNVLLIQRQEFRWAPQLLSSSKIKYLWFTSFERLNSRIKACYNSWTDFLWCGSETWFSGFKWWFLKYWT